ncbi:MAG: hypothetical protein KIT11_11325 [Fimbriimonadaceae bacterium]|nr:hypothetical protein [Fimbriimonadaceae bacterium]QYK55377.1 MAG: hypothetical protein KF733_10210 [Fimbriimonadaceae bacterium]
MAVVHPDILDERRAKGLLAFSVGTFALSCALPCFVWLTGSKPWFGWEALFFGGFGIFAGQFGWFANPLLLLAWVVTAGSRGRLARAIAVLPLAVSLHTFAMPAQEFWADEAGATRMRLEALDIGAWWWFTALALVALAAWTKPLRRPPGITPPLLNRPNTSDLL